MLCCLHGAASPQSEAAAGPSLSAGWRLLSHREKERDMSTGTVNIFQPVPPDWYVPIKDLAEADLLARNGNAVFWRIIRHHADRIAPGFPIVGPPVAVPDYGLYAPGSGVTPSGAELLGPPPGKPGMILPGIAQHSPADANYPVVTTGKIVFDSNTMEFQLTAE